MVTELATMYGAVLLLHASNITLPAYLFCSTQISYMPVIEDQAVGGRMNADRLATSTKLSSLAPNTNYSIIICATTRVDCGNITSTIGLTNEDGMY